MIRLFRHYVPISLLFLAVIEAVTLVIAIYFGKLLRAYWVDSSSLPTLQASLPTGLIFMVTMISIMTAMGLYERNFWTSKADMVLRVGVSFLLGLFVTTLIYYIVPTLYLGRGEFGFGFFLAFLFTVVMRYGFWHLSDRDILKRRILVLGTGAKASQLKRQVNDIMSGISIVGYVPTTNGVTKNNNAPLVEPEKILTVSTTLYKLAQHLRIDEILLAVDERRKSLPVDQLLECKVNGLQVTEFLTFFERETGKIRLDALQPSSMIFSDGFQQALFQAISKRLFDIGAAVILLATTWPVMLVVALAIWIESGLRGPILFRQERVGKNEHIFRVLKFRSMHSNAEQDGITRWTQPNDHRVTYIGSLIRPTHIDELPQLINVLLGNMSFVGPRPERPEFVKMLTQSIPFYSLRHRINPGITGWAQIRYPYGFSQEDAWEKLQYDLYYIKNYSMFFDLIILLQTIHVVLWGGKGAH
jgi:sugar transferase (PEP-CTERM system associated)